MIQKSEEPAKADHSQSLPSNPEPSPSQNKSPIFPWFQIKRFLIPILVIVILLGGLSSAFFLSGQTQDPRNYAKESQQSPQSPTDAIDTLSYMIGSSNTHHLDGSAGGINLSADPGGKFLYYVKWANNRYEYYKWDDQYIYLSRDTSWGNGGPYPDATNYTFSNGIWMKRYMNVGDTVSAIPNQLSCFTDSCTPCSQNTGWSSSYENKLIAHNASFDTATDPDASGGSDIGIQDVIVLQYGLGNIYEKFYYSKQWGYIKWEAWKDGARTQVSVWYKKSGGFKSPQPMCGDPGTNNPNPTSDPGGGGASGTIKVYIHDTSGQEYIPPDGAKVVMRIVPKSGCGGNPVCDSNYCTSNAPESCYKSDARNRYYPNKAGDLYARYPNPPGKNTDQYVINFYKFINQKGKELSSIPGYDVLNTSPSTCNHAYTSMTNGKNDSCVLLVRAQISPTPTPTGAPIQGFIWEDGNANGKRNGQEQTIQGLTLTLSKKDESTTYTTTTTTRTTDYNFSFGTVPNGRYTVTLPSVSGYKLIRCANLDLKDPADNHQFVYCIKQNIPTLHKWTKNGLEEIGNVTITGESVFVSLPMRVDTSSTPSPTP